MQTSVHALSARAVFSPNPRQRGHVVLSLVRLASDNNNSRRVLSKLQQSHEAIACTGGGGGRRRYFVKSQLAYKERLGIILAWSPASCSTQATPSVGSTWVIIEHHGTLHDGKSVEASPGLESSWNSWHHKARLGLDTPSIEGWGGGGSCCSPI